MGDDDEEVSLAVCAALCTLDIAVESTDRCFQCQYFCTDRLQQLWSQFPNICNRANCKVQFVCLLS